MDDSSLSSNIDTDSLIDTDHSSLITDEEVATTAITSSNETDEESMVDNDEEPSVKSFGWKKRFLKVLQTIPSWMTMLVVGVTLVVGSVMLESLKDVVGNSAVSWTVFLSRALGVSSGSLIAGFVADHFITRMQIKFKKYMRYQNGTFKFSTVFFRTVFSTNFVVLLIFSLLALLNFLVPYLPFLWSTTIIFFGIGFCFGSAQVTALVGLNWVWTKPAVPMQIFQFMFGCGVVLFPLIMSQILDMFEDSKEKLYYGYILACFLSFIPVPILLFIPGPLFPKLYKNEESEEKEEAATNNVVPTKYGNIYSFYIGCLFVFIAATECVFPTLTITYLVTTQVETGPMDTEANGALLITVHYLLYLFSKLLVIGLVALIPNVYLLGANLFCGLIGGFVILMFSTNLWVFRIVFAIIGFFVSPLFGLLLSTPSRYGVVSTGLGNAFAITGGAIGVGFSSGVAMLMDMTKWPQMLIVSYIVFSIASLFMLAGAMISGSWLKVKYVLKSEDRGFLNILKNM